MSIRIQATELQQRRLLGIVGVVAALALVGLVVMFASYTAVTAPPSHTGAGSASERGAVGESLPTSFGVVAVESVQEIGDGSAESLARVSRAGRSLSPDEVQVQAFATITNLTDHEVAYAPDQFRLVTGDGGETLKPARPRSCRACCNRKPTSTTIWTSSFLGALLSSRSSLPTSARPSP